MTIEREYSFYKLSDDEMGSKCEFCPSSEKYATRRIQGRNRKTHKLISSDLICDDCRKIYRELEKCSQCGKILTEMDKVVSCDCDFEERIKKEKEKATENNKQSKESKKQVKRSKRNKYEQTPLAKSLEEILGEDNPIVQMEQEHRELLGELEGLEEGSEIHLEAIKTAEKWGIDKGKAEAEEEYKHKIKLLESKLEESQSFSQSKNLVFSESVKTEIKEEKLEEIIVPSNSFSALSLDLSALSPENYFTNLQEMIEKVIEQRVQQAVAESFDKVNEQFADLRLQINELQNELDARSTLDKSSSNSNSYHSASGVEQFLPLNKDDDQSKEILEKTSEKQEYIYQQEQISKDKYSY